MRCRDRLHFESETDSHLEDRVVAGICGEGPRYLNASKRPKSYPSVFGTPQLIAMQSELRRKGWEGA